MKWLWDDFRTVFTTADACEISHVSSSKLIINLNKPPAMQKRQLLTWLYKEIRFTLLSTFEKVDRLKWASFRFLGWQSQLVSWIQNIFDVIFPETGSFSLLNALEFFCINLVYLPLIQIFRDKTRQPFFNLCMFFLIESFPIFEASRSVAMSWPFNRRVNKLEKCKAAHSVETPVSKW